MAHVAGGNGNGVTIYQVARRAQVSPSTVSNVLNGRGDRMQPQTRRRVEKAMEELGYRPNRAARQLRNGKVEAIGLIVPSVANPFWGALARHIEQAALGQGYQVLLCNSERDPERERRYVEELWADGIRSVVLCTSMPSLDHLADKLDAGLRLVAFDRTAQVGDPASLINISVDNAVGARLAAQELINLGHRRIAFVSGSLGSIARTARHRGFLDALAAAGIDESETMLWSGDRDYADTDAAELGRSAALDLLSRPNPPTAFMAINDMCALGICAGVRDVGMSVGSDVSVVGFDDIVLADLVSPRLTTVRQPLQTMAQNAFAALTGPPSEVGESILLRPELIVRESTGPAPR